MTNIFYEEPLWLSWLCSHLNAIKFLTFFNWVAVACNSEKVQKQGFHIMPNFFHGFVCFVDAQHSFNDSFMNDDELSNPEVIAMLEEVESMY